MTHLDPMPALKFSHNAIDDCFALLDDCNASAAAPDSRLYTGHVGALTCMDSSELPALLDRMQQALQQGRHAVGLFSYELGAQLHGIAPRSDAQALTQILLFERCERLSAAEVAGWLKRRDQAMRDAAINADQRPAGIAQVRASVSEVEFNAAMASIHAHIEAGETYQTNYTYRVRFDAYGSLVALYMKLRTRQPVPYGALIVLPDGCAVLSFSPELFVRHAHGELIARPMKGTAAASSDARQDTARAAALSADPKSCAENLMIVDLLRNDLGRIAALGSVQVPRLFEVSRYGDVLQMTSTVQARLRADATLADLFTALYPCGSVTGAPKRRTLQIIRELETTSRGFYTGAIGWFDAPDAGHRIGDFCLSVPIRTLMLQAPGTDGVRAGEMGVGAGIVHDSEAADEYAECRLKARFLTGMPSDFELFETIHATREAGCRHLDRHLQRLGSSAAYFGFAYDEQMARAALSDSCAGLPSAGAHRMRLTLNQAGICNLHTAPLMPLTEPVRLLLALQPTAADDLFLRHKTSVRDRYDAAWRTAEAQGAFDMLFCNTRGELTEGARSNVFIKMNGRWYTPPLNAGVLPGVMRAVLLADAEWSACERRLTLDDLRRADEIMICNALRGALPAIIEWGAEPTTS
jgi:para-aminobenzoate synthetase/4-amino-4-deoxychorismate lyase